MARHTVNIELHAGGGSQVAGEVGKVGKATTDLIVNVKKFGNLFGELGSNLGSLAQNLLKGGVWGIAQSIVQIGVDAFEKWRNAEKEAAEAAARHAQELLEKRQKCVSEYMETVERSLASEKQWIAHDLGMTQKRIALTKTLTQATIELEKARARAMGDTSGMRAADKRMADAEASARRQQLRAETSAAMREKNAEQRALADAQRGVKEQERVIRAINSRIRAGKEAAAAKAGNGENRTPYYQEYFASDEYKALRASGDAALKEYRKQKADVEKHRQALEKASAAFMGGRQAERAFEQSEKARRINETQDIIDENEEARRKQREEEDKAAQAEVQKIKALEREVAAERKALEREVAAEREKHERELHKRRMDDLRAEIAAQKDAASVLTSRSSAAQSEFDRAFAMYRDPSRAAAEIGEEKDYQNDLDRLHRDARRYGGKWRIDELSRLMSAGDTQGVTDTLKEWRRSKGFTPEIEAMVRASAAEKTKTTAEDELRKVNDKVASMSEVLKQIADSQSGKLGAIADSTSGLAAKVDQLLQVKG